MLGTRAEIARDRLRTGPLALDASRRGFGVLLLSPWPLPEWMRPLASRKSAWACPFAAADPPSISTYSQQVAARPRVEMIWHRGKRRQGVFIWRCERPRFCPICFLLRALSSSFSGREEDSSPEG